jgi:allophanate hydrolase
MRGVTELLAAYRTRELDPSQVAAEVIATIAQTAEQPVWITRVDDDALLAAARALDAADRSLPLYGVPFAVKDNIDVAGLPTTAACPGCATTPTHNAPAVQRLLDAGALLVGKTNLDQFATGLVGTRTPYGACASVFDPQRISGGSSSGSAVAVALGQVPFALGTDTAGSGRVPAAFNALVGVKPTRGLISAGGVVPACASLDCVSIFTSDVAGATAVVDVLAAYDDEDPWSRAAPPLAAPRTGRIAIPHQDQLRFDDDEAAVAWAEAVDRATSLWQLHEVDVSPLLEAAPLLYAVWVAERTADTGAAVEAGLDGLDPTVAEIIRGGARLTGVDVFAAQQRIAALRRAAGPIWEQADALLMPTVPGHPAHADVRADPLGVNERLGRFTNFANLMDLAALALPGPQRADGLPAGVTLLAPAFHDRRLLELGAAWRDEPAAVALPGTVKLAVVGAHLSGLALNAQLTERGARLLEATRTAPAYRLYALPGDGVARPGLVRVTEDGAAIEAEVWELAPAAIGELLTLIPAPLGLGRITLEDGEEVIGFLCEAAATGDAHDITDLGGWRAYVAGAGAAEIA